MTIDDKIGDEKLQHNINSVAVALSWGTADEYEYLTGKEIVPFNQRQKINQAKFSNSPLGKAFEKQKNRLFH